MRKLRIFKSIRGLTESIKKKEWNILFFGITLALFAVISSVFLLSPKMEQFFQEKGWSYGRTAKKVSDCLALMVIILLILLLVVLTTSIKRFVKEKYWRNS